MYSLTSGFLLFLSVIVTSAMMASDAFAQSPFEPNQVAVTPAIGLALDPDADVSLSVFGGAAYPLGSSFVIEGELGHLFDLAPGDDDVDSSLTTVHGALMYLFNTEYLALPYVAAGFGVGNFSHEVRVPPASIQRTEVGINLGGGILYPFGDRLWVRGDLRYFKHIDDVPSIWRFTAGVTLGVGE